MDKLISVAIPVYNGETTLRKCVDSILAQTYENIEVILVNDGSTDRSGDICRRYEQIDPRVKVISKENGGLSSARNAGIDKSCGEYIFFIDSDDWIEPEFLSALYYAMEQTGAEIAECATQYVAENGAVIKTRKAAPEPLDRTEALRRLVLEDGVYQTVWNKLYRREVTQGIPFAVGKYNEDEFWTYQVFDRIHKLATVETPLYNYLQRGTSIIGVGYNIRRLDGLEARFRRMEYLQKYAALACLTRQQFTLDCMWHLQCVLRCLSGQELQTARETILSFSARTPKVAQKDLTLNWKYRIWYALFRAAPVATATLRNRMKIGL